MVDEGAVVGLVRVVRAARGERGEKDLVPLCVIVHILQPLVSVFAGERVGGQGPLADVLGKGNSLRDDRSCSMVNRGSMVNWHSCMVGKWCQRVDG